MTTHWDPRSFNILGWYVIESEQCTWSEWTYSTAFSNDTGDYMTGPSGEFMLGVEIQLFFEYQSFFYSNETSSSFEFEDSEDYYYVPDNYDYYSEEDGDDYMSDRRQNYYYEFDLRYYDYYDYSYYSQWNYYYGEDLNSDSPYERSVYDNADYYQDEGEEPLWYEFVVSEDVESWAVVMTYDENLSEFYLWTAADDICLLELDQSLEYFTIEDCAECSCPFVYENEWT